MDDRHKERIAYNEGAFRKLNEQLESNVHRGRANADHAGFVCECGDGDCDAIIQMDLSTYESIRQDSCLFFAARGHEEPEAENVVDQTEHYLVVRKHGDVSHIAEATDPRT